MAGDLRKQVCETITHAKLYYNRDNKRFEFIKDGKPDSTRSSIFTRHLSDGDYDLESGELNIDEREVKCLGGTFNLAIGDTGLVIRDISLSSGKQLWAWIVHKDARNTTDTGDSDLSNIVGV